MALLTAAESMAPEAFTEEMKERLEWCHVRLVGNVELWKPWLKMQPPEKRGHLIQFAGVLTPVVQPHPRTGFYTCIIPSGAKVGDALSLCAGAEHGTFECPDNVQFGQFCHVPMPTAPGWYRVVSPVQSEQSCQDRTGAKKVEEHES